MKYYIYYLPNAVRDYGNGKVLYGKIGCTHDYERRVIQDKSGSDRFGKLDITGHHVLETVEGTRKEALDIEKIWQKSFILLDGSHLPCSEEQKQNQSLKMTGRKKTETERQNRKQYWIKSGKSKPVLGTKIDTNQITAFTSLNEAAKFTNNDLGDVMLCCNKKRKTAKGWKFEYAN